MRLHFLGAEYSRQWPSVETQEGAVTGKYRGVAWSARQYSQPVKPTEPVTLHFMGRAYQAQL